MAYSFGQPSLQQLYNLAPRCLTAGCSYTLYISASIHPVGKIKGCFSLLRAIFSVYHQLLWSFQLPQLLRTEKTGSPLTMSTALHEAIGDYFPTSCSSLSSYMLKWGAVQGIVGSNLTFLSKPWELICSRGAFFFFLNMEYGMTCTAICQLQFSEESPNQNSVTLAIRTPGL